MARGIVFALAENHLGKVVKAFFDAHPLPPSGMSVSPTDVIDSGDLTFAGLLRIIISSKAKELALVVHGFYDGSGLLPPIDTGLGPTKGAKLDILNQLESAHRKPTDKEEDEFDSNDSAITELLDLMRQVRAMKLKTVEWRACNLGKSPAVLEQFRKFFGATLMGAPRLENNFGIAVVNIRPFDKIPDRYNFDFTKYYYPDKDKPKVEYYLKLEKGLPVEGALFAEKKEDIESWIHTKINPKAAVPENLPMHHLWVEPDDSRPLDSPTPILPLEKDYSPNIIYARG
jgi:hypothetical protein